MSTRTSTRSDGIRSPRTPAPGWPITTLGRLLLDAGRGDEAAARSSRDEATRLYDAAIAATEQAIACEPVVDPRIIHNLAEIHMDRGDVARAIVAYQRALEAIRKQDPRRGFGSLVPQYVHELEAARQKERDALLPR